MNSVRYELLLDRLLADGRLVVINSSNAGYSPSPEHSARTLSGEFNVPLGTKFTQLYSRSASDESPREAESVSLHVVEIEFFRNVIESIPAGHNAAVRFEGEGIELVRERLSSVSCDPHYISLVAPDVAAQSHR